MSPKVQKAWELKQFKRVCNDCVISACSLTLAVNWKEQTAELRRCRQPLAEVMGLGIKELTKDHPNGFVYMIFHKEIQEEG